MQSIRSACPYVPLSVDKGVNFLVGYTVVIYFRPTPLFVSHQAVFHQSTSLGHTTLGKPRCGCSEVLSHQVFESLNLPIALSF